MSKKHQSMVKIPHPGSDEAIKQGCSCPISDNEYGRGCGKGEDGNPLFWMTVDCPLHGQGKRVKAVDKLCTKCGIKKKLSEYYSDKSRADGLHTTCKICQKEANKRWKSAHSEWYVKNADKQKKIVRKWHVENINRLRAIRRKSAAKTRSTPKGKINANMATAIGASLCGAKKGRRWEKIVGYTVDQLTKHLKKQFTSEMTWENYGYYWHIDHIIPISAFNYETPSDLDFKRCWALRNLQPLEARENLKKQAKTEKPFQPSLAMTT